MAYRSSIQTKSVDFQIFRVRFLSFWSNRDEEGRLWDTELPSKSLAASKRGRQFDFPAGAFNKADLLIVWSLEDATQHFDFATSSVRGLLALRLRLAKARSKTILWSFRVYNVTAIAVNRVVLLKADGTREARLSRLCVCVVALKRRSRRFCWPCWVSGVLK